MGDIVVIGEHEAGKIKKYTVELGAKAAGLAAKAGGVAHVVFVGSSVKEAAASLGAHGVKKVTVLDAPALDAAYNSDGYTTLLANLLRTLKPHIVLASSTPMGRDCLPRVAMRLSTGLVADSIALDIHEGQLVACHPIFAGKALAACVVEGTPQMALCRPNAFGIPAPVGGSAEVRMESADPGALRAVVKESITSERGEIDLTEAEVIVSGGRALGSADNFQVVRELAQALGASVGASRAAVDAGYIGHNHQVGQTGKTVNPTLYVACGISGAIQHLAGMRTARYVVAINKDPEAPIFGKADFGVVGDLFQILPILTEKIKKAKAA